MDGGEVDYAALSHAARIDALIGMQHTRALLDAREQRLLHAIAADPVIDGIDGIEALVQQWVREDVAAALRIPPVTAQARLDTAATLVQRLPATLTALDAGRIALGHARRLADAVTVLPDPAATNVEKTVLARAGTQTVPQFAVCVRRAVLAADPRAAAQRHTDALAGRRVVFTPHDDGVTELWALLPAPHACAVQDAIHTAATTKRHRGADGKAGGEADGRSVDQRRADALVDLILGPGADLRPQVHVTVALSTLLTIDDQPGELDGHGPIPAALARALAHDPTGTWNRLVTDPTGAHLLDAGRERYRPPTALDRYIRLRDLTCRFPGCRRPARRTDLDHITAWADGGPTNRDNLHALCQRHHTMKHNAHWTPTRQPDSTTQWRAPTGHTYQQPPPPRPTDTTVATQNAINETDADPPF